MDSSQRAKYLAAAAYESLTAETEDKATAAARPLFVEGVTEKERILAEEGAQERILAEEGAVEGAQERILAEEGAQERWTEENQEWIYQMMTTIPKKLLDRNPGTDKSSKIRSQLEERDGMRCQGCGMVPEYIDMLHSDHKIPKRLGGSDELENRLLLCEPCNRMKGYKYTLCELRVRRYKEGRINLPWYLIARWGCCDAIPNHTIESILEFSVRNGIYDEEDVQARTDAPFTTDASPTMNSQARTDASPTMNSQRGRRSAYGSTTPYAESPSMKMELYDHLTSDSAMYKGKIKIQDALPIIRDAFSHHIPNSLSMGPIQAMYRLQSLGFEVNMEKMEFTL